MILFFLIFVGGWTKFFRAIQRRDFGLATYQMKTLCDIFESYVSRFNRPDALSYQGKDGRPYVISTNEFKDRVVHFAIGLTKLGMKPQRRLALISENRPEWQVVDFACHLLGVVVIPVNPACSREETTNILASGEPECTVISGQAEAKLKNVEPMQNVNTRIGLDALNASSQLLFEDVLRMGREEDYAEFLGSAIESCQPESVATIVYGPDSDGKLRGVMLSHVNLVAGTRGCASVLKLNPSDKILCMASFANTFVRISSYLTFLQGSSLVYSRTDDVTDIFKSRRPTVLSGDPQFYRNLKSQIERGLEHNGILRRFLAEWSIATARQRARKTPSAAKPRRPKGAYRLLARMALSNVWPAASPKPRLLLASGPLAHEESHFLHALGLSVLESFGLPESSSLLTMNPPLRPKPGTAGLPLPGISIRIADNGEVMAKGENVMVGYHKNQNRTKEAVVDGWLGCGVFGKLDDDGYLVLDQDGRASTA